MSNIICVTNRKLCSGNFLSQIEKVAASHPAAIILREKDLTEEEYASLARQVMDICSSFEVDCILHSFTDIAISLNCQAIHLPLPLLRQLTPDQKAYFKVLGASCHSRAEAMEAQSLGCSYITAGHIFDTDCKKGLPGRGLDFLRQLCRSVDIPVYAIGGITSYNMDAVLATGAHGACMMSSLMK